MKKLNLMKLLTVLLILSCSSDDNSNASNQNSQFNISKMTVNSYDNNMLTDSIIYNIQNNKIINAAFMYDLDNESISETTTATYNYSNNKLSSIKYYNNNQLTCAKEYSYNTSNDFVEYKEYYSVNSGELFNYLKIEYIYNDGKIISNSYKSDDDLDYELIHSETIIIDNSQNITSSEITYSKNSNLYTTVITYDANNNLLSKYFGNIQLFDYTYTDVINPKSILMDNTFGRQVLALDYVGSNFTFTSPSILSPNVILSADKEDNASNVYNYEISHEVNENNYATKIRTSGSFEYNEITEFTFE